MFYSALYLCFIEKRFHWKNQKNNYVTKLIKISVSRGDEIRSILTNEKKDGLLQSKHF